MLEEYHYRTGRRLAETRVKTQTACGTREGHASQSNKGHIRDKTAFSPQKKASGDFSGSLDFLMELAIGLEPTTCSLRKIRPT